MHRQVDQSLLLAKRRSALRLRPVADMLGGPQTTNTSVRREMQITLRGRFQDVQAALQEMQVAPLGIFHGIVGNGSPPTNYTIDTFGS